MSYIRHLVAVAGCVATLAMTGMAQQPAATPAAPPPAGAPRVPPPPNFFMSSQQINELIERAKVMRRPDQASFAQRVVSSPPVSFNLEYIMGDAASAIHETQDEVFFILEGTGRLVTNGKLTAERRTNPENILGDAIEGGESKIMSKGDVALVVAGTSHWFTDVSKPFILISGHIPHPRPAQ